MSSSTTTDANQHAADDLSLKRKRSPSLTQPPLSAPPAKTTKTNANQLSINYLARSSNEDLPLANKEDTLPNLLHLLGLYSSVLDRHESLASNLGARPLGPILIKRFERCFDTSPKIVASHHKNVSNPDDSSLSITWLEVIEFARSHPAQFTLSTFSEGQRVCQFYLPQKQLRVQISEEDYLFINSGRCQELIPPLPIWEDEEKEVSTCDVLDARLKELTNVADMVAARTRQLCHRLKGRRAAILERRAEGGSGTPAKAGTPQTTTAHPSSSGFTAVNIMNGKTSAEELAKSSATMRNDLLRHFESLPQNQSSHTTARHENAPRKILENPVPHASSLSPTVPTNTNQHDHAAEDVLRASSVLISNAHRQSLTGSTPSKHNFSRPLPAAMESSQPFRPLCQAHMDALPRGQRVLPPCDRCRRLRMDCVKNLTSCAGCTKKHARCHWRDVNRDELRDLDHLMAGALNQESINENDKSSLDGESGPGAESDEDALTLVQRVGEHAEKEHAEELARRAAQRQARSEDTSEQGDGSKLLSAFDTSPQTVSRRLDRENCIPLLAGRPNDEASLRRTSPDAVQTETNDNIVVASITSLGGFRPVNPAFSNVSSHVQELSEVE
ncbi:hypothetical protein AMS68_001695 [Peltaster fructicola]|uniref:Zn(2)-C6 fungal-type domain-containing protein n=1 Tax=Peltaster fructicola TaxID=286661 RepID=A0A6H0XNI5_9PEZI|nr:hypothetical protein AMS68_001695 [Peltaster fructicola]